MIELQGTYNSAKIFSDNAESSTIQQIQHLLNQPFIAGSQICVMPDVHAGMGCTIGMTMTITDKVVPNFVGVDISCGMLTSLLQERLIDFNQLDKAIRKNVPSGFDVRQHPHRYSNNIDLSVLRCAKHVDIARAALSIGTLGGGNHFIELGQDDDGQMYLIIHTGSRNLGKQVCEHYQKRAANTLGYSKSGSNRALAYLDGTNMDDYIHDMRIIQNYADLNRQAIADVLERGIRFTVTDQFSTLHNYIDLDTMILRKGAVSSQKNERMLIPMNMRDGSLLCMGKGNPEWNYSAPHGAGRTMSRTAAKAAITLTQYEKSMEGVYSTSVTRSTIDESPFAYKPMNEIIENSSDTMTVIKRIKSVYNFKAV